MQKPHDWFKGAIIYSLDIRSFKDGNHDGLGDIKGLLSKFEYLIQLGIDCIWMTPFCRSSGHDDGYDVVDYYQIDPALGNFADFGQLIEKAKANNIKIVLDLVVNHTSVDHPWFKEAIEKPNSIHHDYYIWKKQKPDNDKEDLVFKTVEDSNWEYEPTVGAFFYHTFYKNQPDLNIVNPRVQTEILNIIDFWMAKGIDGFRFDAIPHILRDKGNSRFKGDPYALLKVWEKAVKKHNKAAILIGEADVEPEEYPDFLGNGKLTGLFNFYLNNYTHLALATQRATPLYEALGRLPLTNGRHYLNFLRNHDELDLERLTEKERQQVFKHFAPDPSMIIYDRGIRRRLPPMLDNDTQHIKLAMSLLLTLPGSPVIRYGEEIGMGDDLSRPERKSVRTAMQWSAQRNGGFSDVAPAAMRYPLIHEGPFSYKHINAAAQTKDPTSLLNNIKSMIEIRKTQHTLFAAGHFTVLQTDDEAVLAYGYGDQKQQVIVLHNFAETMVQTQVTLITKAKDMHPLRGCDDFTLSGSRLRITLPAYAYSWLIS